MTPLYGPHTWEVCRACNFNKHWCPGCGTDLTHAEAERGEQGADRLARPFAKKKAGR
jgi:hypothetical protein